VTDLEQLRALLAAATPRPWNWRTVVSSSLDTTPEKRQRTDANLILIVATINALPALLDELERLRGEVERLRRDNDSIRGVLRGAK
jgi:hypothetical protein